MLDMKEIRSLDLNALNAKVVEVSKEIYNLENELRLNRKLDQPHLLRLKKKEKARLMLTISEKKKEA